MLGEQAPEGTPSTTPHFLRNGGRGGALAAKLRDLPSWSGTGLPRGSLRKEADFGGRAAGTGVRGGGPRAPAPPICVPREETFAVQCTEVPQSGSLGFKACLSSATSRLCSGGELRNPFETWFSHLSTETEIVPGSPGCGEVCMTRTGDEQ